MMRVIIAHGWDGYPEEGWFPWLKKELEKKGFDVIVPQLPDAENPRIDKWLPELDKAAGIPDEKTFFVGHSMGCQAIARYLEKLPDDVKIGGVVFVAGFFKRLTGLEDEEVGEIADHWLSTKPDFDKIKSHLGKGVAIFSDDDPWVPLDNQDDFKKLGCEIIIEHSKGHFSGRRDKIFELPVVLKSVLGLANKK